MARILTVDDDPAMVELIQRALQREGHQIAVALQGQAALELARRQPPDLILLDIIMPEMDGIEVCQALRTETTLAAVPVLFLTAKGMIEDKLAAFDAGGDDYLTKPFDLRELVARVRALVRRSEPPPEPLAPAPVAPVAPALPKPEPVAELPFVQVYALGRARVIRDGRLITNADWDSATTKELFFYFLVSRTGRRKEQVLDNFWQDTPVNRANSIFHSTLYRLRRALSPQAVLYQDGWYYLNPALCYWFDVEAFKQLLDQAHTAPPDSLDRRKALEDAISLYQGDFLEEFYSDWPFFEREALRERYITALVELADIHTQRGDYPQALELYKAALAKDSYREDVLRKIMACYTLAGNRGAAVRYYEQWRQLYEAELGVAPSI
jgi:two-component SAPR family response regulator